MVFEAWYCYAALLRCIAVLYRCTFLLYCCAVVCCIGVLLCYAALLYCCAVSLCCIAVRCCTAVLCFYCATAVLYTCAVLSCPVLSYMVCLPSVDAAHLAPPCASATVYPALQGPNPYDEVDILVHCDVGIFEWLFEYIHSTSGRSSNSSSDKNDHSQPTASRGSGGGSSGVDVVEAGRPKPPVLKVLFFYPFRTLQQMFWG